MIADDLRHAWRMFRRAPALSLFVVLMMAGAIGANTAVFSMVYAVLLRPLPFREPDRLVGMWRILQDGRRIGVSPPEFADWRQRLPVVEDLAGMRRETIDLVAAEGASEVEAAFVTPTFFPLLGVSPRLGRVLGFADGGSDSEQALVLSDGGWRRLFQGDPGVVGRHVKLIRKEEETPQFYHVVGVVEADFRILGQPVDVFVPELTGSRLVASRNYGPWYTVIGRLRPGISIRQANEAARRAAIESAQLHPSLLPVLGGVAEGLHASQVAHLRPPLSALSLAVGFVLLIACVNVAALLLTASPARMREFAIRTAIGATRGRVVRQVMLEYLMLASAGGAGGLAMAKLCVTLLPVLAPGDLPRMEGVALDWAVLLFTASVSLLSGIALGIAPAAVLARADLTRPMTGATGLFFARRHGWGDWILGAQLTLVLALMVVTGLAVRSASNLLNVDLGFRSDGVVGAEVFLGRRHYAEDRYDILQRDLMALASTIPGVTRVALVYDVPPSEEQGPDILYDLPDGRRFGARFRPITPAFFELLQIPILAGRGFQEADRTGRRLIVNQAFARRCFARTDVVGMRMRLGEEGEFEIIGVVRDVRERGWAGEPEPTAYTFMGASWRDRPPHFWLLMKSSLHEGSYLGGMRGLLERVDPDLPVRVTTLSARMRASWAQLRFYTALLTGFSLFGVLLAAVGVHAVVSSHVNRRTREFGVRLAIGATPRAITTMVLTGALRTALLSAVAGLWLGVTAGRGLTSLLFGLKATDPTTLGTVMVLLLMVVAAAAYQPAARAGSVDPTTTLRQE